MELNALYKAFQNLIGDGEMLESVRCGLLSDDKDNILSAYIDMVNGDLETDNLQKIFQYYYADRGVKCQDYTPKSIARLCAAETETNGGVVYDVCAGSGALAIQKWVQNPNKQFICEELDERVIPFLLFNMSVRNMNGYVINRNALTLECGAVYKLKAGKRFSDIEQIDNVPEITADEIVSNPPYNIKWNAPEPLLADSRFQGKPIPPASKANYAFVLSALHKISDEGRCAFVLPNGVLSSNEERDVREYMVGSGIVERVISLPDKMFESTSIGTCVIVFSRGNKVVKFYDCRKMAAQEQRDQNGQFGGKSHENRTYHKIVNVLPDNLIAELCADCKNISGFSKQVSIEEIAANDYNLVCSRYIDFMEREEQHRPYADIISDINRIARERSVIKITCNETLAKRLGLYDVAILERDKMNQELDKTFQIIGGRYESRRYITLSKNKNEFKIENQDKEILSSLVNFFLPMWKQHIFYLNEEENRLLEELRNAMLPELMSGKLPV